MFGRLEQKTPKIVIISGGQNVDIMSVLIRFSEMRVFSQVNFFNDFFEKSKGKKRTWANPMGSKQWKALYEIDNLTFLFIYIYICVFSFFEKV